MSLVQHATVVGKDGKLAMSSDAKDKELIPSGSVPELVEGADDIALSEGLTAFLAQFEAEPNDGLALAAPAVTVEFGVELEDVLPTFGASHAVVDLRKIDGTAIQPAEGCAPNIVSPIKVFFGDDEGTT